MNIKTSTIPVRADIDGLAVIGRTRHALMGIRYGEGEGGDEGGQQQQNDQGGDNAPWTKENFDPERAFRLVENLRADAAAAKTKTDAAIQAAADKAQKDTLAQFAKLLGGGEQEETDPVKLAAKVTDLTSKITEKDGDLTKAQASVKAGQLSTAVAILSHGLGGSARLLLANEDFKTSIASVEPTDEAAITAKIKAAIQANAALKTTPPSSGSTDHQGGQVPDLEKQLAAATKAGDMQLSITLKRRIADAKRS
ncbi:hypothetical protein [Cryobacterium arcticum]|uniref:Scaffolding protein n=1 Tax=Cryobacterium arcticum TaxID=670052 RepID=A0A1B1BPF8_9MICO|nr:hypothetical protein [Cryobacterium arcticum]ANP74532.1 hypothetical protein PA27867_3614 [Cryobacterium arcticum]